MAKVKSLWEDQQEARFEEIRAEVIEDYRFQYHADDDGDVIDEIAWERQQVENGESQ